MFYKIKENSDQSTSVMNILEKLPNNVNPDETWQIGKLSGNLNNPDSTQSVCVRDAKQTSLHEKLIILSNE
uniref:Uncharacterized protein n=1 Tax=Romanomermis culicivorax TaxID=13658 RepID=A0A915LBH4_ROMCU